MNGREVAACGDSAKGQRGLDLIAVDRLWQADDKDKPTDGSARESEGRQLEAGNSFEERVVAFGGGLAHGENFADAGELNAAEGAGQLREAIVIAGLGVIEPIACGCAALVAQAAQARSMGGIVSKHCAAFAGGDLLVGIKAKDSEVAEAAYAFAVELRADCFAGVFNQQRLLRRAMD